MLGVAFSPFQIKNVKADLDDWASADHSTRRLITYDSDNATIAPDANASNVIIYLTLGDSNCSDITDSTDDENDLRFYGTDSTGAVVELDYDVISDDMVDGSSSTYWKGYVELVHVPSARNTTFYVYYAESDTSETGYEDATGTYANGQNVYHFEGDPNDVFNSKNGSNSGSPSYSTSNGRIGQGVLTATDSYVGVDSLSVSQDFTIISWIKFPTDVGKMWICSSTTSDYAFQASSNVMYFSENSGTSYISWDIGVTETNWNMYTMNHHASGNNVKYYENTTLKSATATVGAEDNTLGSIAYLVGHGAGSTYYPIYADEILIFTEDKTLNFIKHYYYTTSAPASYLSFGDAEVSNASPNAPTITKIGGSTTVNATVFDSDTGDTGLEITLDGYNSSDPDSDNQYFRWSWDTAYADLYSSPDGNTAWLDSASDINSSTITSALSRNAYYYVGLESKDPSDAKAHTYWKIYFDNRVPSPAVITSPTESSSTRDTTPSITWNASTDGDGDDFNYCVVIKDDAENVDVNSGYLSTVTSPYTPTALDVDTYSVTVYTYDGFDTNSSTAVSFDVVTNSPPGTPSITSVGGVTEVNSTVYDEDTGTSAYLLNLKGYNASDPDNDNMSHRWSWSTDYATLFTTTTSNSSWLDNPADINSSTITSALTRNAYWYIGLESKDDYASAKINTFWKVLVENKAPTAGTLSAPTNASETYDTTPELSWGAGTDDDGDTLTMQVKVYDASGNKDYNNTFGSATSVNSTALDLGTYTWRVRYYDGYDYTNSSDRTFTVIANTPPNKAVINTIAGVATGNDMYDEDTGAGFKLTMNGTNSSDYDHDNQKWAWIIDDDSGFGSVNYNSTYVTPIDYEWTTALTKNKTWYFRVDAIDPLGSATANSSATFTGTMENKAPTAVTLSTPADSTTGYDKTPSFTWSLGSPEDDDGDNVFYALLLYDGEGNLDGNSTYKDGNTSYTIPADLDLGTYTWKVVAYDHDGTYYYDKTNSSTTRTLTIIENTSPLKPTITLIGGSDTNGSTIYDIDATSNFLIYLKGYNSSDPDGDDQSFGWLIDDDGAFGSATYDTRWFASHGDINVSMTTALTKKTWYYFRLDTKDPLGCDTVNSSVIRKHYIGNYVPTKPVVTSPTTTTYDTTPAITWNASTNTDGDVIQYKVEISNASGIVRQSAYGATSGYANATALDVGDYNVAVTAYDGYDTNASANELFTVIANTVPNEPTITTIGGQNTNATIYNEITGANIQITVAGYNSSDTDGDNQKFKWEVDDDSAFGSPETTVSDIDAPADINRALTDTLTKKTYYYFRLGAIDPLGANDYNYSSPIFKMYLGNYVPSIPVVTDPTTTTSDTTPAISWTNSSDTDGDTLTYVVEISNASGVVRQSAWGVSQPYTNATALDYGDYNITIYVYDTYDQNTSAVETFTVLANQPPLAPTITSVAGSATNATVYDQDATAGVLWYLRGYNSSDPDGNNQEFLWQIDDNSNFGSPEYTASGLAVADINRSMTTALARNTSYYVRLGARDPLGSNTYNYSTILLLLFENYAPTAGILTAPDDNVTTCDTTVFLSWTAGSDTDGDTVTKQVKVYDSLGNLDYNNTSGSDVNATTGVLTADTYTWCVRYYDGYDYTNSSDRTFTVINNAVPSVPTLSTPANFAKDIDPATVTLDWADSTDACSDAITYTVQWSTSYSFTTYTEATSGTSTYAIPTELYTEQIYYWRVKATDVIGSTAWSSIYEFQTESASGGSGSDQYEVRTSASYDEDSGTVEVISWIQKNGVQMTGISGVSVVMKDEANTTLHNFNDGTVYTDGFYRATWTATGLHGLYSLRTTLTYSGTSYTGGSHFDAGIMELFDALDTMTTTINTIEANVSSALTYIGDPTDTASDSTLFGYGQFIKDKWGTYTAEQIYNKVIDVYNIAVDANSTSADVLTALSDLDTYVTTYMGVDIRTSASYSFVNDELQIAVAYVQDGAIKDTTSCTLVVKDSDGTTLKTFTDAEDADHIYRYEWNTSAVDFPANGLTGLYTLIPSVVYNGGTFTTVSHFSAEMPDVYGTTTYTAVVTPYRDSGYSVSVVGDSITEGEYLYVRGVDATMPDTASATVYIYWEDVSNAVLSTTTTTGTVDTGILRVQAMTPSSVTDTDHVRLVATKTDYGHHTVTMSGVSGVFSVAQKTLGSGLGSPINSLEIRSTPVLHSGKKIDIAVLADASYPATCNIVLRLSKGSVVVSEDKYTATLVSGANPLMLSFPVPNEDTGSYSMAITDGFRVRDTETFELVGGKSFWSVFEFEWKVPGTNIIISTK